MKKAKLFYLLYMAGRFESNFITRDTSDEGEGVRDKRRSELRVDDAIYAAGSGENAAQRHAGEREHTATLVAEQRAEQEAALRLELQSIEAEIQNKNLEIAGFVDAIRKGENLVAKGPHNEKTKEKFETLERFKTIFQADKEARLKEVAELTAQKAEKEAALKSFGE